MYFWVPITVCPKLTSFYVNYVTNGFIPVVQKRILDIMLPVRTSSLPVFVLVKSLVYFSILHPRSASLFQSSLLSIFRAYILASRVYFSRVGLNQTHAVMQEGMQADRQALRYAGRQECRQSGSQSVRQAGRVIFSPLANFHWSNKNSHSYIFVHDQKMYQTYKYV